MPNSQQQQTKTETVDVGHLEQMLRENTEMTKATHRILVGEPEYGREGLVKKVDRHDLIIIRGGTVFCTLFGIWEVVKVIFFHTS